MSFLVTNILFVPELETVTTIRASKLEWLGTPPSQKGEESASWVTDVPQLGPGPTLLSPQCLLLLSPAQEELPNQLSLAGASSWSRAVLYLLHHPPLR